MLRWNDITETNMFGTNFKMYREPFRAATSFKSSYKNLEFDHYAFRHLQSELFSYKIMDVNFERYVEERGDLNRTGVILIPTSQDAVNTVL